MDAVWYGIASFMEFIFELVKPFGMAVNIFFLIAGIVGSIYWLWYTVSVKKGGQNFMSNPGK